MKKIGSEFYNNSSVENRDCTNEMIFDNRQQGFLSGRTALEYIIRDAQETIGFESILLPSYCCHSMIEPFVRNNVTIRFYSVVFEKDGLKCMLPEKKENEALYLMPYFGFYRQGYYNIEEVKQWKFCILDETHSCFSKYKWDCDEWNIKYTYSSYRKWADIKGFAVANKVQGNFQVPYPYKINTAYLKKKRQACILKQKYIENNQGNESQFLLLYSEAEEMLDKDYVDYKALEDGILSFEMLNLDELRKKRRRNGAYLLDNLKNMQDIKLLYKHINENDCPLFIPILVESEKRNQLRNYLMEQSIYCPIHWPVSELHKLIDEKEYELYEQELSIICDQRYEIEDMKRIIEEINKFMVKNIG